MTRNEDSGAPGSAESATVHSGGGAGRVAVSYRVVLPRPWVRLPVGRGMKDRVSALVEEKAADMPKNIPPDQVGPWKRDLERRLVADLRRAREYGGIDLFVPTNTMHGVLVGASFIVSSVTPPEQVPEDMDPEKAVGAVLAELVASQEGTVPVTLGDTAWIRTEKVQAPDTEQAPEVDVPTRRVTYTTAVPGDEGRWITSAFSCVGDGDPESEASQVTVDLFDAIMSTWRWTYQEASS